MTTTIGKHATIEGRVASLDWPEMQRAMDETGYASLPPLLTGDECRELRGLYDDDRRRSSLPRPH